MPDPEVERLRAEVEALRAQLDAPEQTVELREQRSERHGWWRPVVVTVLIVIMAVLAPLAVVARWAHNEISDTDRYVASITPLASDPAVQKAVADRITSEITSRLRVEAITQEAVGALADRGLPPLAATSLQALSSPLANAIEGFVGDQVTKLVESDEFETAWVEANRQAHTQMVAVLTGKDTDTLEITDNAVSINLATLIETVKQRLVDRGFTLAERLPPINAQFTIFESADITKAQNTFRLLGAVNTLLPILALLCLAGAIGVARDRRRTLVVGALAVAASMLLLGVALNAFRMVYLDAIPTDHVPANAAGAIYDTLVYFIRLNLRALLALFLAIAFIGWVSGAGRTPVAVRRGTGTAIGFVRSGSQRAGLDTGRLGVFLDAYKGAIRGVVLGLALLVYVMEDHPTGRFTIILLIVAAVVLLITELLARPPVAGAPAPTPTAAGPGPS